MTEERTTALRERMIEDMRILGLGPQSQRAHIRAAKDFTGFLGRSPDTATTEELRAYQLHMTDTEVTPSVCNARITASMVRLMGPDPSQLKVMSAIEACRTEALGGHVAACTKCDHQHIAYNSCKNRHCPKCQGPAARDWMAARAEDLLPVEYFHVVFTLPAETARIALWNKRAVYGLLFRASAETLMTIAADAPLFIPSVDNGWETIRFSSGFPTFVTA